MICLFFLKGTYFLVAKTVERRLVMGRKLLGLLSAMAEWAFAPLNSLENLVDECLGYVFFGPKRRWVLSI